MEHRLRLIYHAASELFINKGYSRTQMKDIARKIGLSTGMLYVYFTGKQDILRFLLKVTIEPDFICQEFTLPLTAALFTSLDDDIMRVFEESSGQFAAHMDQLEHYPLEAMLSDAFDTVSQYGVGCLLIEKNPDDLAVLAQIYRDYRRRFFQTILHYVQGYMDKGTFRKVEHRDYCVQLIVETLSWWGMHVMNDAYEVQKDIPISVAKSVCLDNLLHAYGI